MLTVPKVYRNHEMIETINSYIDNGFKSYDSLLDSSKKFLASLCVKAMDNEGYVFLTESKNLMKALKLLSQILKPGSEAFHNELCEILKESAVEHSEPFMSELYDELYKEYIECDC